MPTKTNPGPFDCHAAALPDEQVFTLLGRDPALPATVRFWIGERTRLGKNENADDISKIVEAAKCANAAETWREAIRESVGLGGVLPWHLPRPRKSAFGEGRPIRVAGRDAPPASLDLTGMILDALDHPLVRRSLKELLFSDAAPENPEVVEAQDDLKTHYSAWRRALVFARDFGFEDTEEPGTGGESYWDHELRAFDRTFRALGKIETRSDPERGADTDHASVAVVPENALDFGDGEEDPDNPDQRPAVERLIDESDVLDLKGFEIAFDPAAWSFTVDVSRETCERMIENSGQDYVEVLIGDGVDYRELTPKGYLFDGFTTGRNVAFIRDKDGTGNWPVAPAVGGTIDKDKDIAAQEVLEQAGVVPPGSTAALRTSYFKTGTPGLGMGRQQEP